MRSDRWLASGLLLIFVSACKREEEKKTVEFVPIDRSAPVKGDTEYDPNLKPVYPADAKPAPIAERLCAALHTLPATRRAECCKTKPAVLLTGECVRNLSGALALGAVELEEQAIAACEAAIAAQHEGCDWVGPLTLAVPEACLGIIRGKLAKGAQCRSSLECGEGARCIGVGPTDLGKCGEPLPAGRLCNTAVDALATFVRQDDVDVRHPACTGFCDRNRCYDFVPAGGECKVNVHCGRGSRCKDGRCVAEAFAAVGEKCLGGDCAPGLRCSSGKCITPKALGETCATDFDCKAACVAGKCAQSCSNLPMILRR